jgi:hypothetical protein
MIRGCILRPDLMGGIAFCGHDLGIPEIPVYDKEYASDLVSLSPGVGEDDLFTRGMAGPVFHMVEKLYRCIKVTISILQLVLEEAHNDQKPIPMDVENPRSEGNLTHYSDAHIKKAIDIFATMLASMAPLLSTIALFFVQDLGRRLAVLCAFTMMFSTSLAIVTNARRVEIFACTAA